VARKLEARAQGVERLHHLEALGPPPRSAPCPAHGEIAYARVFPRPIRRAAGRAAQPEHSARWMIIVLASGYRAAFRRCWSTAAGRNLPSTKSCIVFSIVVGASRHAPWPCASRAPARGSARPPGPGPRPAGRHRSCDAAILFAQQRLAHGGHVEGCHKGTHGEAIDGGVAIRLMSRTPVERKLQGAGSASP